MLDERGQVVAILHHATDVTDRGRAEADLRQSEARYRQIVEGAEDFAIVTMDAHGIITGWSTGARHIMGWTEAEALGQSGHMFFTPEDRKAGHPEREMSRALDEGKANNERWHMRRDGSRFWGSGLMMRLNRDDGGFLKIFRDRTAEHEAITALQASEERFRTALQIETVGAIYFDMQGTLTDANDAFLRMSGYGRDALEAGRLACHDITPDEWRDDSRRALAELQATGRTTPYEKEYVRPDGTRWWALIAAKLLPDGTGFEFVLDITERKQAELRRLALVELSDRIRDTHDADALSFAAAEILGRTLGVSRAGYGTIDTAAETITIVRDWNAPGIRSLAGVLNFRDYGSYIEDLKRGETVVFADAGTDPRTAATADALKAISAQAVVNMPVTEPDGFVALLYLNHATARAWSEAELALVREVAQRTRTATERLRAEADLRTSEARLRELNETLEQQVAARTAERDRVWANSRDLLLVVGIDGVFRAANPAWASLLGWSPDELVGRCYLDLIHPDDRDASRDAHATAALKDLPLYENRYRHKDGSYRWLSWLAAPEGDLIYAYGRDVSAEKQHEAELAAAQEQLRQAQKMEAMGQLTGGVAHDFNNLLTPIMGSLDMLQRRGVGDEREQRMIGRALQSTERARLLVQRLLSFARRQPLQPVAVDLAPLVEGMAELIASTTGPQIRVVVETAPGLPPARADPNQLEMAILNLSVNARDAMQEGGTLRISVDAEEVGPRHRTGLTPGRYLRLSVADTGAGMDAATLQRAVEPFFSTKGIGKGTGLGLSMVHGLASQLGGALTLRSTPGVGTHVELWLPQDPGRLAPAGPETEAVHLESARGTALLVDDEDLVRMNTAEMLSDLGYAVVEAASAEDALALVDNGLQPDVLVTDHLMPGMTGTALARTLRQRQPGLPVVVVSGYAENEGLAPDLPLLTKPFRGADLAATLAALG